MSRVGKAPIYFDKSVQINMNAGVVNLKGPKGALSVRLRPEVTANIGEGAIELTVNDKAHAAFHGLCRALLQNAVTGVAKGWTRELELNGVGYRASVAGKKLEMSLGYSHPISYEIPEGIEIKVDKQTKIAVTGADRQKVGQVASVIRGFRPPEPYLGKGVKYADERIRRKAGKAAGK